MGRGQGEGLPNPVGRLLAAAIPVRGVCTASYIVLNAWYGVSMPIYIIRPLAIACVIGLLVATYRVSVSYFIRSITLLYCERERNESRFTRGDKEEGIRGAAQLGVFLGLMFPFLPWVLLLAAAIWAVVLLRSMSVYSEPCESFAEWQALDVYVQKRKRAERGIALCVAAIIASGIKVISLLSYELGSGITWHLAY